LCAIKQVCPASITGQEAAMGDCERNIDTVAATSGRFRLEHFGWNLHPWKAPPLHGAHPLPTLGLAEIGHSN
jgi:hypothetical protein